MTNYKSYASPMAIKSSLPSDTLLSFSEPNLYRSIVGALQYLIITQPDLSFAINHACQFMCAPTVAHFNVVKWLLRYLQGTLDYGLHFAPSSLDLHAYLDSDWRKSTAKKQCTVLHSSTEAEYRALAQAAAELAWLHMLLHELHLPSSTPTL
ncbi:uncharacterized protein LOC114267714 [Camellia sinensis]|uniref:uncharacterized protein LOC114267714 n=1 Tax=Camellia sinensis TaxID=4442 RepID=UPI0010360010|nr:uncharacterized protein LOC114267714 [Camellia sinensis]